MSIRSQGNPSIKYASVWSKTGKGAVTPKPGPPKWYGERGCFGGGYTGSDQNVIEYVTIHTTGNGTDFGDLTQARQYIAGASS